MAKNKSPTSGPPPAEPTAAAKLTVKVGPAQLAEGTVPPEHARHLITTFGILGCMFSGIGGVVLTLHVAAGLTTLALAELALTLAATVLIAVCDRAAARRKSELRNLPEGRVQIPGKRSS